MAYSREIEKLERQFAENPRRFAAPYADALRKSDEVARALEVIQVGLELNPEYIPGNVILGRCHLDLGDDNGAEAAFSRVLDLDNENVIALKSLADIMERQGRHDEAVSFLTYLLDVDRSNDEAKEQLSRIQARPPVATAADEAPPAPPESAPTTGSAAPTPIFGAPPGDENEAPPAAMDEFLEPTALWEPPVDAPEASISSWIEPTTVEFEPPAETPESLVEDSLRGEDVPPMDGLEATEVGQEEALPSYNEFQVEREEEIILTSMAGSDYQVANDSEALLELSRDPAEEADEAPEEEEEEAEAPVSSVPATPASLVAAELAAIAEAEAAEAEPDESEAVGPSALAEEAPLEWAMHVGEEREFVPAHLPPGARRPDSFDAAIEGIAPVDEETPDDAEDAEEEAGDAAEAPVLVVTESMAELYAAQGHASEALGVYRILYDRNPDNERLRLRIQDLEAVLAAEAGANATPSFAASVTGGSAVASFLGAMLQARPGQVDLPEPPPAPEPAATDEPSDEDAEEAVASGAPTRPAVDRLSLGAIFGEDTSPVPPAENAPAAEQGEAAGGFSFDDFFGGGKAASSGRPSGGSVRATRAADDEDDLDQFHSWLQSLKR